MIHVVTFDTTAIARTVNDMSSSLRKNASSVKPVKYICECADLKIAYMNNTTDSLHTDNSDMTKLLNML